MNLDEKVTLSEWRLDWETDFEVLAETLTSALGDIALRVDHIGSTSVPGLLAKDVIDAQVIVAELNVAAIVKTMATAGFGQKLGDWNLRDHIPAGWVGDAEQWSKLLFSPQDNVKDCNVHVRVTGSPNERYSTSLSRLLEVQRFSTHGVGSIQGRACYSHKGFVGVWNGEGSGDRRSSCTR